MGAVEIITCDRFGGATQTLSTARVTAPIRRELNNAATFSFEVPLSEPQIGSIQEVAREVQVWWNGTLKFWGPIISTDISNLKTMAVTCQDPMWYFTRLHFGGANRNNFLVNGSFDTGSLAPWQAVGVAASVVTDWGGRPGVTYQLNLDQQGSGEDTFVYQTVALPGGVFWTLTAFYHVRTDTTWVGPAIDGRGLYVERLALDGINVDDVLFWAITDETPRGVFEKATIEFTSPPNETRLYRIRLYATRHTNPTPPSGHPAGGIIWDDVKLTAMESTSFVRADLASVVNGVVTHAQDWHYGKADLNIAPGASATGVLVDRTWQHADHGGISAALQEITDAGLGDLSIDYTSPTSRRLLLHYPQKGVTIGDVTLELDSADGILSVARITGSGDKTATSVIALGEGDGPSRDEAAAADASQTGGVVLEEVLSPKTEGLHYDLLPLVANEYLAAHSTLARVIEATVSPGQANHLNEGDAVHTTIRPANSQYSIDVPYRIVATELNPETDEFRVVLNKGPA